MDKLDLNIENYAFEDILKLFYLDFDYTYEDLKKSFKIVAQLHPDKCNLPVKYFIFFKKAYSMLLEIYKIKQRKNKIREEFYRKDQEHICQKLMKSDNFNKVFNELFDETVGINIEADEGYKNWLQSDNGIFKEDAKNITELHNKINKKKEQYNQLVKTDDIQEFNGVSSGFSSGIFGNLKYYDVKQVHEESVIPISENALDNNRPKTLQQMNIERSKQKIKPHDKEKATRILNNNKKQENQMHTKQLFEYMQEQEKNEKLSKKWWSKLTYLTN
jgi:hypothetical protein